jgi:hypothetical protein
LAQEVRGLAAVKMKLLRQLDKVNAKPKWMGAGVAANANLSTSY